MDIIWEEYGLVFTGEQNSIKDLFGKKMKAIFEFKVGKGFTISDRLRDLIGKNDFRIFLAENEGVDLTVMFDESSIKDNKMKLFRFLNGPLISTLMKAMIDNGEMVDKTYCMLSMKVLYAKDLWTDSKGQTHSIILSQSDMSFNRLLTFVQAIIHHLESEYNTKAPDSEYYLKMKYKSK